MEDYENAILNAQKALTYAKENVDVSYCYFKLGYLYSIRKNFSKVDECFEKSTDLLLKSLSANVNEVMKGRVKDRELGERYYHIAVVYSNLGNEKKSDDSLIKSALCGDEDAIIRCKKLGLRYY